MRNSKKLVNLISLVVLVATNILSPLSYATAGEEDIGSVSDTVSYGAEGGFESEASDDSEDFTDDSDMEEDSSVEASDSDEGDVETPMDSDVVDAPQNDGDTQEGDAQDFSAAPQNDEDTQEGNTQDYSSQDASDRDEDIQEEDYEAEENPSELEDMPIIDRKGKLSDVPALSFEKPEDTLDIESAGDPQLNWVEGTNFGSIRVNRPGSLTDDDGPEYFIVMDRNLGATTNSTSSTDAYGFHYQWGNNHGFPVGCYSSNCSDTVTNSAVDVSVNGAIYDTSYDNSGYYGELFIKDSSYGRSYWRDGSNPDGLWGGSGDSSSNNWGLDTIQDTAEDRQGPCPSGWHVPSIGEWRKVLEYRCINTSRCTTSQIGLSRGVLLYLETETLDNYFLSYLYLPKVGARTRADGKIWQIGRYAYYWTSSPGGSLLLNFARPIDAYSSYRNDGRSVRCFKNPNKKYTVTYDLNGGYRTESGTTYTDTRMISYESNENGTFDIGSTSWRTPSKIDGACGGKKCMFDGWYLSTEDDALQRTGEITENMTVYAKWLPFEDFSITTGGTTFVIMDRNIGATASGTGCSSTDAGVCGSFFAWGNNYGFKWKSGFPRNGKSVAASETPNHGGYVSTYYSNKWIKEYPWISSSDGNLWGGDYLSSADSLRQGPCPDGYHVPYGNEWSKAIDLLNGGSLSALSNNFNLPVAGIKYGNTYGDSTFGGVKGYWVASAFSASYLYNSIFFMGGYTRPESNSSYYTYSYAFPVRCFQNTTGKNLNFETNGGSVNTTMNSTVRRWEDGETLPTPTNSDVNREFRGWFTTSGFDEGTQVTTNAIASNNESDTVTIYAKWKDKRCTGNEEWYEELGHCAIKSEDNIIYYYTGSDGKGLISVMIDDGTIITMLDRNQGAITNDITNTGSYGLYYQWGNNYGFAGSLTVGANPGNFSTDKEFYKNYRPGHSYNNSVFRYEGVDYWENDTHHNNLWGGGFDTGDTTSIDTFYGGIKNGATRRGPCDEGYHVPSIGEWNALIIGWNNSKNIDNQILYTGLDFLSVDFDFMLDFKLPLAGYFKYSDASFSSQESQGLYWSSSPSEEGYRKTAYYLNLTTHQLADNIGDPRSYGYSIRCFKDSPDVSETLTLTFDENGGNLLGAEDGTLNQLVASGKLAQEPVKPTKVGYTFTGWTTERDGISVFDFSNPVTASGTLYAKWESNCPDGEEWLENENKCYPSRAIIRDPVSEDIIQMNDQEWNDLELFFLQSDGTTLRHFTIMDRNMGATEVYNGQFIRDATKINTNSFGYHYQWGNNYGFEPCINNPLTQSSCSSFTNNGGFVTKVSKTIWGAYIPSKYARNKWSTTANWMDNPSTSDNIWGGGGDSENLNHDGILIGNNNDWNILSGRQGPCPEYYYIPSEYDWKLLKDVWGASVANANSGIQFASDLLLPPAGYRYYQTKAINAQGLNGRYWSSSSHVSSSSSNLMVAASSISLQTESDRSLGYNVRCAKGSPTSENVLNFTLHANGGTGAMVAFTGTAGNGNFTVLGTPTRKNSTFDGWYTADEGGYKLGVGSGVVSDIYARFNCNSGYADIDGECIQGYTVEFEAYTNGGLVNMSGNLVASGAIRVESGTVINLGDYVAVNDPNSPQGSGWLFDGWGTIPERQFKITSPTIVVTGDITLHALFYKVYESYFYLQDVNAGSLSSNAGYCTGYNGSSCDPIAPIFTENDGYTFDGFSYSQGSTGIATFYSVGNSYYAVTHETTPVSIIFEVNGNDGTTENRECYKYNGDDACTIKSPDIIPPYGFTKIGWSTGSNIRNNSWPVDTTRLVSESVTYYAQSKKEEIVLNVTYIKGDGISSISSTSGSCIITGTYNGFLQATGCKVISPDIVLKPGYGTGVWIKNSNPSIIANPGSTITLTSNDVYIANATPTFYTITYHENGGSLVGQKTTYTVEDNFTLVTPTRSNYEFRGWTGSNGTDPQTIVTVNSGTVGPLEYYANWDPITYTIIFSGNAMNTLGTQSSIDATYDSGNVAPESDFTRPGYTFTSWNTQSDGNGVGYNTGSELKNLTNTSGDVVTLYAIWQANTDTPYVVHYYLENIDDANYTLESTDTSRVGTTDDEVSVNSLKKEITGAHFEKAAVVVSPQGPEYGATSTVDSIIINGEEPTVVYLFYKRNTHTVIATAGEGVGSVAGAGTYKYGTTVTLTPQNINSCYTANPIIFTMLDDDVQKTLNGTIKTFTVTLQKGDHIASVLGANTYNCGEEATITAIPSNGYEFNAWMSGSNQISTQSSYTFTVIGNVSYMATASAMDGTKFTVKHWIKDINADTYTKYLEEEKSGVTDSQVMLANHAVSVPCGTYVNGSEDGGVNGVGIVKINTTISGSGDTIINLFYDRNLYAVTTSADTGIQSVDISEPYQLGKYECGAEVTITATLKTGYHFTAFSSTDVDSSIVNPYTFIMPDKAVSIQSQSNVNTYSVQFNANGGTGTMSPQTFTYNVSQDLSDNLFIKTGYDFAGWSTNSGAISPTYTDKQSVQNLLTTGNIILYAIWTTNGTVTKYTVRHIRQGLSTPTDDIVVEDVFYAETNSVQTPTVNVYEGYNSPSTGVVTVTPDGKASIDYVYTRKNIILTLDKDNGMQNMILTGKFGANVQKPVSNPTKTGYTFISWLPSIPDTFPAMSGIYVAQYTLDTYTITYNLNSGTNHVDNPTSYTYLSGDITLKAPIRSGYLFNGWQGTDIVGISKTVSIPTHSVGNRSYTAIWGEDRNFNGIDDDTELKYTVIYTDGVEGEEIFADQVTNNLLSGFDTPIFNGSTGRVDYLFAGWKPTLTEKVVGNVTYIAQWKEDFNHNGIDDATEPSHTLTIHYVNGSGGKVYEDYVGSYVSGVNYNVESPLRKYYTIQTGGEVISGVMGNVDVERTVIYLPNNDKNENGIADEEEVVSTPSGGGSSSGGGGGGGGKSKIVQTGDSHGTPENILSSGSKLEDVTIENNKSKDYQEKTPEIQHGSSTVYQGNTEMEQAYNFSYQNGITTVKSYDNVKMYGSLTRIQMAKMLSYFAINVLGHKPNTSKTIKFDDVSDKLNAQYNNAVTLAYQLGIMGINMKNNNFRPNDGVTRAEFATALSRLLYKTDEGKYKSTSKYYEPHIAKLYQEGIINNTNPELKEKRGYVMIMLMRSAK